jgi:hypothetical protein
VLLVLTLGGAAPSQTTLRPVEQGIEDRTANSASQRVLQRDLRSPAGFDRLYRIEGSITNPAWVRAGVKPGMYARVQGGVVAVFPQSAYRARGGGRTLVEVPASTKFLFGDTRAMLLGDGSAGLPSGSLAEPVLRAIDQRVSMAASPEMPISASMQTVRRTIWTDESFRRVRVASILNRARAGVK